MKNIKDDHDYGDYPEPQLTKEQAIQLAESGELDSWDAYEIVAFQLFQERLCMDFGKFHEAVEEVLGRPVWTHEFGWNRRLQEEFNGLRPRPSMEEIMSLIPPEKLIVLQMDDNEN
jgi:hypothetical protein